MVSYLASMDTVLSFVFKIEIRKKTYTDNATDHDRNFSRLRNQEVLGMGFRNGSLWLHSPYWNLQWTLLFFIKEPGSLVYQTRKEPGSLEYQTRKKRASEIEVYGSIHFTGIYHELCCSLLRNQEVFGTRPGSNWLELCCSLFKQCKSK